jgi:hypothetical protein
MPGKQIKHMIEKRNSRVDASRARPVQRQIDANHCLFGFA